jgi:hypothetical protein
MNFFFDINLCLINVIDYMDLPSTRTKTNYWPHQQDVNQTTKRPIKPQTTSVFTESKNLHSILSFDHQIF